MPSLLIDARQVSRELGGVSAVENLSLTAHAGQVIGLLGPNGAGKTTTLRMLAGLMAPTRGQIRICGHSIPEEHEKARCQVGFLTSGMRLYENFSPRESFRFFGKLRGMQGTALENRIDELVHQFQLQPFANRHFSKLSAGEKQRCTIANTVLHSPSVLILDEITLSLDVIASAFILDFVRDFVRQGSRCVLFSTHVMSEAEYLCDEIALIHKGRVIAQAPAETIKARYSAANLTEAFLRAVNGPTPTELGGQT